MILYLWTMIVLLSMGLIGKLTRIATDEFPPRKRNHEMWDVVLYALLIVWSATLINR